MPVLTMTDEIMTHLRRCVAKRDRWVFLGGCPHGHVNLGIVFLELLHNGVDPGVICRGRMAVANTVNDETGTVSVLSVPKMLTPADYTSDVAATIGGHTVRGDDRLPDKDFLLIACNGIDRAMLAAVVGAVLDPATVVTPPERNRVPVPSLN